MPIDFADIKPSVLTALLFILYALALIPATKFFLSKYHIPGLSELASAL